MALKERFMVENFENTSEIELRAKVGESLLIKGIYVTGGGDYATAYIDKTTVGYFRTGTIRGSHLVYPAPNDYAGRSLLDFLYEKGIFKGYPVAEGQTFVLKTDPSKPFGVVTIEYELYDAGDIHPNQENGSEAGEYFILNYGEPSTVPNTGGDVLIDTSLLPAEFPAFPFGDTVPAKTDIELFGFAGAPCGCSANSGQDKAITKRLKLIKDRVVLFDTEKEGIPLQGYVPASDGTKLDGWVSLIGENTPVVKREPLIFEKPLTFSSGDELNVYITVDVIAGNNCLTAEDLMLTAILKVKRGQ